MELTDIRFGAREEVFVAHLVEHGAAGVIQRWWRTVPRRMRRLRYGLMRLPAVVGRAAVLPLVRRSLIAALASDQNQIITALLLIVYSP